MGDAEQQQDALAAFGLKLDTPAPDINIEVWPDNWQTLTIFADMASQWNVGMSGVIGLRYEALPLVLKLHQVKHKHQQEVFNGLRVMERAAVQEINKH